jgi:hypothetical protein
MNIRDFIALVPTKKSLFHEIAIYGTTDETQMLKELCKTSANRKRLCLAWSLILHDIHESLYPHDVTEFLSDEVLEYLIAEEIELITLGHLQLSNKWLLKIYEKDNRCIEALQTVELRNKQHQ